MKRYYNIGRFRVYYLSSHELALFLNLCADSVLDLSFRMRLILLCPKSGKTRRRASG